MEVKGFMTELERYNCGNVTVIVSYWTNHNGTRFAPKMRFVVGEEENPLNGLKHEQACMIREAFNSLCDSWPQAEDKPKPIKKTISKAKVAKKTSTSKGVSKQPLKKAESPERDLNLLAADAIAKLMAERAGA